MESTNKTSEQNKTKQNSQIQRPKGWLQVLAGGGMGEKCEKVYSQ